MKCILSVSEPQPLIHHSDVFHATTSTFLFLSPIERITLPDADSTNGLLYVVSFVTYHDIAGQVAVC